MSHPRKKCIIVAACLILILVRAPGSAQAPAEKPAAPFKMTIDNIMRGPDLVGSEPSSVMWSVDGKKLYFRWKKPGEKQPELYFITKQNPVPQKTTIQEMQKLPSAPVLGGAFRMFGFGGFGGD